MELFWTNNAIDNLDETLTYWIRRNKSKAYSEKIAVAVAIVCFCFGQYIWYNNIYT